MSSEMEGKRLELLKEVVPKISHVAVLRNAASPIQAIEEGEVRAAAQVLGMKMRSLGVRTQEEIEDALAAIVRERPGALLVLADRLFLHHRTHIMDFAAQHRLPGVHAYRELVEAGGLMSYGPSYADMHRRAATYVDKILKGAKPADLPVERPTKFEMVINLKTANLLRRQVALIVGNTPAALAAKAATTTVPIVFVIGLDPVSLRELRPGAARIAVLADPKFPGTERIVSEVRAAASVIGQQIEVFYVSSGREIETAFTTLVQRGAVALLVGGGGFLLSQRERIAALAARHRIPAIYVQRDYVEAGGLMSYAPSIPDTYRQAGIYAGRILKGEKPLSRWLAYSIQAFVLFFPRPIGPGAVAPRFPSV
jgi:ABC-type uncharacterized transport system substrate-binding protein